MSEEIFRITVVTLLIVISFIIAAIADIMRKQK